MADTINSCIRTQLNTRTFHDLDLVCVDGTVSYPKLVAGLIFPSLSSCNILEFPINHTLILPDYTVSNITETVETVLGFNVGSYYVPGQEKVDNDASDNEDTNDLSRFLHVEATEMKGANRLGFESDEEYSPEKPLICSICFATFKTKSGWRNHKVTHQKFRTKEFACYICYRMFYWDKDCRRHIKNIHGEENYDRAESRKAARNNHSRNRIIHPQPSLRHQHYLNRELIQQPQKIFQNSKASDVYSQNNNIFKMKIELLKSHEKKAINTDAIKKPNAEEAISVRSLPPVKRDCFFNEDSSNSVNGNQYGVQDKIEDSSGSEDCSDVKHSGDISLSVGIKSSQESTITMEEIKNHIKKVKEELGELLDDDGDSSDESVVGDDDAFETIDPNLYEDENTVKYTETNDSSDSNNLACTELGTDGTNENVKIYENLKVDMFDFILPKNVVIEPQSASDLFLSKKRLRCAQCPRKFVNDKYLNIHQKSCLQL